MAFWGVVSNALSNDGQSNLPPKDDEEVVRMTEIMFIFFLVCIGILLVYLVCSILLIFGAAKVKKNRGVKRRGKVSFAFKSMVLLFWSILTMSLCPSLQANIKTVYPSMFWHSNQCFYFFRKSVLWLLFDYKMLLFKLWFLPHFMKWNEETRFCRSVIFAVKKAKHRI